MYLLKQKLDFRTKFFMTAVISFTLLIGNMQQKYFIVATLVSLLPYFLLLASKKYKAAFQGILIIFVAGIVQMYLLHNIKGIWTSLFLFITMFFLKMLPGVIMGKYTLMTTDMSEVVNSLKKMKFPDQIIIPITVMVRFFYTISEDYTQIKNAMYMHGLTTGKMISNPLKMFEYKVVPLLMCLTRTADEVSISAMTRGLEVGIERSSISESRLKTLDYIFFVLMFILIGFFIRSLYA